jgi:hypothetical protein
MLTAGEEQAAHTSVLSPDAGCLASVVSKVRFRGNSTDFPYPKGHDAGSFACLACSQRRHRGFR